MNASESAWSWPVEDYRDLLEPPWVYGVGAVAALLVVLLIVWRIRASRRGIVPFQAEGGRVEVAPRTLRSLIRKAAEGVEGVERARCGYRMRGRKLHVKVGLSLRANSRLVVVQDEIRRRVRAVLKTQVGMEQVEPIDIKVDRLVGEPTIPAAASSAGIGVAPSPARPSGRAPSPRLPDDDSEMVEPEVPTPPSKGPESRGRATP